MANGDGVFSLFQDIHVRIDMKIDTFTSIKPTTTKSRKQLYLEDATQMREVKQDHVTNRKIHLYCKNPFGNQTPKFSRHFASKHGVVCKT